MSWREIEQVLPELGFRPAADGRAWKRRNLRFESDGRWSQVSRPWRGSRAGAGEPDVTRPGLWRRVDGREVFELPPGTLQGELLLPALAWALATADGAVPEGWAAPSPAELEAWVPPQRLIVRSGSHLAQGSVHAGPHRLAIAFELRGAGETPSGSRGLWVEELLADTRRRLRMVRSDYDAETGVTRLEVDLSGAPRELVPTLVQAATDGLACVVRFLLAPVSLLLDPSTSSSVLERHSPRTR